jgi:hypothetical protein
MPTKAASKPVQAHTARPIDDLARAVLKTPAMVAAIVAK